MKMGDKRFRRRKCGNHYGANTRVRASKEGHVQLRSWLDSKHAIIAVERVDSKGRALSSERASTYITRAGLLKLKADIERHLKEMP